MKYIQLILYNKNPIYDKMKEITEKYYNTFDNIITIYYCFNNDITTKYKLEGNILYIKGVESFIPGILDKTIKAFEFIKKNNYKFNYIIRSNISTLVDFKLLDEELTKNPIKYYSGSLMLSYNKSSSKNKKFILLKKINNISFISGTCIILSNKGLNFILNNKNILEQTIDDVAIGIVFLNYCDYFKKNNLKDIGRIIFTNKDNMKKSDIIKNKYIFYRNRDESSNRKLDIVRMKKIISIIK